MTLANVHKQGLLYEGKAKKIYATDDADILWIEYKDDATAFNGAKKETIQGKGLLNNRISTLFFKLLHDQGVDNHFVRQLSDHEQLVRKVTIIPIEVVVRNVAAGSLAKRLGLNEGMPLRRPIIEFYYKDDALNDPFINEDHIEIMDLADAQHVRGMKEIGHRVNTILIDHLRTKDVQLIDFKLEFGQTDEGVLLLADEISPDTCRLWDMKTNEKLDKDRFRRGLGGLTEAYEEILKRLAD